MPWDMGLEAAWEVMVTADKESHSSMGSAFNLFVDCESQPHPDDSGSARGILGLSRDNKSFKEKTWRCMGKDLASGTNVDENSATAKTPRKGSKHYFCSTHCKEVFQGELKLTKLLA